MGIVSKFVASKFSGYLLIAFLVAAAGAGYWFWTELKEYGSLTEKAANLEEDLSEKKAELQYLNDSIQRKQKTLTAQQKRTDELSRNARQLQQQIEEARNEAPQEYLICRDVIVPERLRFGESREDSEGEAGP